MRIQTDSKHALQALPELLEPDQSHRWRLHARTPVTVVESWNGLGGKGPQSPPRSTPTGRDTSPYPRVPQVLSNLALENSRDGSVTAPSDPASLEKELHQKLLICRKFPWECTNFPRKREGIWLHETSPHHGFPVLKDGYHEEEEEEEEEENLSSHGATWSKVPKVPQEKFDLHTRKKFLGVRPIFHWDNFPEDVVEIPLLEDFGMHRTGFLPSIPSPHQVGPDEPSRSLLTRVVL